MALRLGTDIINKVMLGDAEVNRAYLGADLVYGTAPAPVTLADGVATSDTTFTADAGEQVFAADLSDIAPWIVTVDSSPMNLLSVSENGAGVFSFTIEEEQLNGPATFSYNASIGDITNAGGGTLAGFLDKTITPYDTPVDLSALDVAGDSLSVLVDFAVTLDSGHTPDNTDFTVTASGWAGSVTGVSVSGQRVTVTVSPALPTDQDVSISYARSSDTNKRVQNAADDYAESFGSQVARVGAPVLSNVVFSPASDTLSFDLNIASDVYLLVDDNATRTPAQVEAGGGLASDTFSASAGSTTDFNFDVSGVAAGDHYLHIVAKNGSTYSTVDSQEYTFPGAGSGTTDMVMEFTTTVADESITIPINNTGTINATIDWNDGGGAQAFTTFDAAVLTKVIATPGVTTVNIAGEVSDINFFGSTAASQLTRVVNFGELNHNTLYRKFRDCVNMTEFIAGNCTVNSAGVTNASDFLRDNDSLVSADFTGFGGATWGHISNMANFYRNSNTAPLNIIGFGDLDIGSLTSLSNAFLNTALTTGSYDAVLIGWEAFVTANGGPLNIPNAHFGTSTYTAGGAAEAARTNLINTHGWTITDGGTA